MTAIVIGALAALGWGFYDFLIRFVSRLTGSLQAILFVLTFGAVTLWIAAWVLGEPIALPEAKFWPIAVSGVAYAGALMTGYRAFTIGPISFVAPIVSAYPVLSMLWAYANGSRPSLVQWLGVASVLIGVALVARYAAEQPEEEHEKLRGSRLEAFLYAAAAGIGFAFTFAVGQIASQGASEISVTFLGRLWSIASVLPFALHAGLSLERVRSWLPLVALMGAIDGTCLLGMNAVGKLPDAEYAAVLASAFGVVTVILAVIVLRERMSTLQFFGIACVFSGIVALVGQF
jgi:drug/metabolite transporter (DMT)-like permease